MEILNCKNLSFYYNGSEKAALKNINFSVCSGELILIMGKSGCGKTTLLKLLKPEISPFGRLEGEIFIGGEKAESGLKTPKIGFVMQNPESQTVCDTVFSELCFGLENMGLSAADINRRVGETVSFFGIERLVHREISTLSGGEKQLVNLCAVMAMDPDILILDEPVSRLDPVTAESFMSALVRLNRETGTTVIMAEHFCEGIFHECDKVMLMSEGEIKAFCAPEKIPAESAAKGFSAFLPCAAQAAATAGLKENCPLTVRQGRSFLAENFSYAKVESEKNKAEGETVLCCKDIWFRYEKSGANILSGLDFSLRKGEIFTVAGSNGAGKSTLLKCLGGILSPYAGKVKVFGKPIKSYKNGSLYKSCIAMLPQDPYDIFVKPSVAEDWEYACKAVGGNRSQMNEIIGELGISHLMDMHPYDLSGGEAQLCAIGRILLCRPKILLLDEPVKALDPERGKRIGSLLLSLKDKGISILCVSHSLEFAAEYSDRCGLFFDGRLAACADTSEFFTQNRFYTTAVQRMSRGIFDGAVTVSQVCTEIKRQVAENDR